MLPVLRLDADEPVPLILGLVRNAATDARHQPGRAGRDGQTDAETNGALPQPDESVWWWLWGGGGLGQIPGGWLVLVGVAGGRL